MAEEERRRLVALLGDGDKFCVQEGSEKVYFLDVENVEVDFQLVVGAVVRTARRDSVGTQRRGCHRFSRIS